MTHYSLSQNNRTNLGKTSSKHLEQHQLCAAKRNAMSSAAITPQFRALGWNIHFLCGPDGDQFAGLFHPPGSTSLTFRDVINEFRLCFEIPNLAGDDPDNRSNNPWVDIAFGYVGSPGGSLQPLGDALTAATACSPPMIYGQDLDNTISTPAGDPSSVLSRPPPLRLHVVRHIECSLSPEELLTAHLRGMFPLPFPLSDLWLTAIFQPDAQLISPIPSFVGTNDIFLRTKPPETLSSLGYRTVKRYVPLEPRNRPQNGPLPARYLQLRTRDQITK